ncbi:hypothetical protein Asppvi_009524 [Aspergillus pseudoviridinutans]|uniref:FAD-binding domain-containing protein n=1 Tax=Aspergillus pseudoviridinutans TaxID=1517512 RepID=A0A9P3BG65_9EURO|nr:uncharacterized protein Asppvi_009524 [Aspergillus pseudoviridinutans]GIJ90567.1 hypothetical protein Asppvi_009524 [Aspergillus pseudoviridinutans]
MEKPKFKVIIVGGSIAGLTLAHCLHRANIDHVVLEKRSEIASQEGAIVAIWPTGARVFEQLGLYDDIEKQSSPFRSLRIRHPDGFSFSTSFLEFVNQGSGYPVICLDRRKLLEVLHQKYPSKANILVKKKVIEVQPLDHGARVLTEDGDIYTGDLIVGADGVHSSTRSEMWRLADAMSPGLITTQERKSLQTISSFLGTLFPELTK